MSRNCPEHVLGAIKQKQPFKNRKTYLGEAEKCQETLGNIEIPEAVDSDNTLSLNHFKIS